MTTAATRKLLALSMLKGIGPVALRSVVGVFPDPSDLVQASIQTIRGKLERFDTVLSGAINDAWPEALAEAQRQCTLAEQADARVISIVDAAYPPLLRATKSDPVILYVKGAIMPAHSNAAAVIGTREPTHHGTLIAERITHFYIKHGWSIVSGLANGCDSAAHKTAIENAGHTVAVLAHGLHTIVPAENQELADSILAAGGALVSEYAFGQPAIHAQFIKRDRIQAALSQTVVMVQSDLDGGSLHAARAALKYGRHLAVPYPTDQDLKQEHAKVQANRLICEGTHAEITNLLNCSPSALERLVILRGREDYPALLKKVS